MAGGVEGAGGRRVRGGLGKRRRAGRDCVEGLVEFGLIRMACVRTGGEGFEGFGEGKGLGKLVVVGRD